MSAISQICEAAMQGFAAVSGRGKLAEAEAKLGREAYLDVAIAALRKHVKRVIVEEAEQRKAELSHPGLGQLAAQAALADIVSSTVSDVVDAAGV